MILESMQDQGLGLQEDMFSTGDNPHGCGHAPRTVYKGDRTTAANYFVNKGPNLSIKTDTTVDKVILEKEGSDLRATAVKIIEKDGTTREIKAKKEIIVSGGAYCSPTVLMRSGIGAKSELAQHNIECKVDLPGVGKNLMDHLVSENPSKNFLSLRLMFSRSSSSSTPQNNKTSRTTIFSTSQMPSAKHTVNGKKKSGVLCQLSHSEHSDMQDSTSA